MSAAIASGILVLVCATCILIDVWWEHRHRIDNDRDTASHHRALMREIRGHIHDSDEEADERRHQREVTEQRGVGWRP